MLSVARDDLPARAPRKEGATEEEGSEADGTGPSSPVGRLAATVDRLRREVQEAQAEADGRALIELAKGILVERLGCGPSQAARQLTELTEQAGVTPLEFAVDVINQAARDRLSEVTTTFLAITEGREDAITAWGDSAEECEKNSLHIIRTAERFLEEKGKAEPFGPVLEGYAALAEAERRERAAALAPHIRALASEDRPQVGHFTDTDVVLDFLASAEHPRLAALGTSCPDHFLRTKVRPLVLDLPPTGGLDEAIARLKELHAEYRDEYAAYYRRHAEPDSPAMRGADPAIVLVPGVGMFSFGKDKQTARVAGEFYVNAINVMRGAEAVSAYAPIEESEKFRIEYWALEEAKLQRMPKPKPLATRVALVTGAGSGIGKAIAHRLVAEGACVVVADLNAGNAAAVAEELGGPDKAVAVTVDVTDEEQIGAAFKAAALAFGGVDLVVNNAGISISKPLLETSAKDWDLQHDIMARGSFLVSREAARVMIAQGLGGDIVYIASKNAVFAGPNNIAYSATKADQAHQVRLLAAELGEHGIRVNGVNPDGVVRGSGIFAAGWGAQRAATYGIEEEKLGEFYAQRTILKREVLPEHVANAVFALTGGELTHTTGLHVPVDAGVAAAFLR
ncbi:bifunctional rhamnulose-1-phosphate aldolase/short-chain dehydrogenase [Streptomyces scabiei]|uniref:bifunctional rhamnulose-1-phosphate aldolase/short-chain dehydrogenase n=1 Tax=Streptomyces scabiei TaxID=1930 RepID=UPI0038F80369